MKEGNASQIKILVHKIISDYLNRRTVRIPIALINYLLSSV
jgi:hypothetical protein